MGTLSDDTRADLENFAGSVLAADLVPDDTPISGKVLGFCGIGRPEKFDATLRDLGLDVVDMYPFPDHHPYTARDLDRLARMASEYKATLVTTQKDFVRLPSEFARNVRVIPVTAKMHDHAALRDKLALALDTARLNSSHDCWTSRIFCKTDRVLGVSCLLEPYQRHDVRQSL
jgi:tetraacyldisaccharide 4'-kinase